MQEYRTVAAEVAAEFTERRSRFIGRVCPVSNEEEAQAYIAKLKKEHWDATHNVWAYVLREGQARRYSDDGEPQGTAGVPVLDVLQKAGLTDCVTVVTRYFGGILLGAGGLVRAYSHAVSLALEAADVVCMRPCAELSLCCDYSSYGYAAPLIASFGGVVDDTVFADAVTLSFHMPKEEVGAFAKELTERSAGSLFATETGETYYPFREKKDEK